MTSAIYAIAGIALAVALTVVLVLIRIPSGDPTIQPEGEPDPGKPHEVRGRTPR